MARFVEHPKSENLGDVGSSLFKRAAPHHVARFMCPAGQAHGQDLPLPEHWTAHMSPVETLNLIRAILHDQSLSYGQRSVIIEIALCNDNKQSTAWASYEYLHKRTGIRMETIASAIRAGENKYFRKVKRGAKGSWQYRLCATESGALSTSETEAHDSVCASETEVPALPKRKSCTSETEVILAPLTVPTLLTPSISSVDENDDEPNYGKFPEFVAFWGAYPHNRRQAKGHCLKIWVREKLASKAKAVLQVLEACKKTEQWRTPKFIPLAATWLNNKRWDTDPDDLKDTPTSHADAVAAARIPLTYKGAPRPLEPAPSNP